MAVVADELLLVVKTNTTQAIAGLDQVEEKGKGLGDKMKSAHATAVRGFLPLTAAIVGIGAAAGKLGTDFESEMATLQANAGFTAEEIAGIEGAILDASGAFGESTGAIADAAFMLKSSGMTATETAGNLDAVGMAANANLGEMGDLAQLAGVAFANFGSDAVDTFDTLTVAAGNAIVGPDEMGQAFQQLMGPSGAAGQSLEEMAKNTTILTNAFGSAKFATTKYKAILTKTLVPAQSAVDALDAIGISAGDFKNSMGEDVVGTLRNLQSEFNAAGMSDDEWIAAIFPDAESFTGAAALLGAESADAIGDALNDSGGALGDAFGIMSDTAEFKMGAMKQTVMNTLVPMGVIIMDTVVPALKSVADWIKKMSDKFQALTPDQQKNILKWAGIVAAIGPVLVIGGKLVSVIGGIIKIVGALGKALIFLMTNPIGLIILAIAALVAAGYLLYKNWDTVVAWLREMWEKFATKLGEVWDAVKSAIFGAVTAVKDYVTDKWNALKDTVIGAWETVKEKVSDIWNSFTGVFSDAWDKVTGWWDGVWKTFVEGWDTAWEGLTDVISGLWEGIKDVFRSGMNGVISFLESGINTAVKAMNKAIDGINLINPFKDIPHVPSVTMPRLASGGTAAMGGFVKVGDRGPEIMHMPKGATVTPLSAGDGGGLGGMTINVNGANADAIDIAREVGWEITMRGL